MSSLSFLSSLGDRSQLAARAWARPLLIVHLLVIGSLLFSSVASAIPVQNSAAAHILPPDSRRESETAPPIPRAVRLALRVAPVSIEPAGIVTFTVVVTNTLPDRALSGLVVSDTLPSSLAYWPGNETEFSYLEADQRLAWSIEQLEAGATVTGTFQAQVMAFTGVITNVVSVRGEATDVLAQAAVTLIVAQPPCPGSDCTPTPTATATTAPPTATATGVAPPCLGAGCTATPTATDVSPTSTATWTPTPTATPVWMRCGPCQTRKAACRAVMGGWCSLFRAVRSARRPSYAMYHMLRSPISQQISVSSLN